MIVTSAIELKLLLLNLLSFIIAITVFKLVRRYLLNYSIQQKNDRYSILLFKFKIIFWCLYSIFFVYQYFRQQPYFTIFILLLISIFGFAFWRDFLAGIFLKLDKDLLPGKIIRIQNIEGKLLQLDSRTLILEKDNKELTILPYSKVIRHGYVLIESSDEDLKIIIKVKSSIITTPEAKEDLIRKLMTSPWASTKKIPEFHRDDEGNIILIAWAFSAKTKWAYSEFVENLLSE